MTPRTKSRTDRDPVRTRLRNRTLPDWKFLGRKMMSDHHPLIMGILNVTPDSFSDGGKYSDTSSAIERGLALEQEGADIIDIGGESSRPGAEPVTAEEELKRVIPVIRGLAGRVRSAISIDTVKAEVARRAINAGAVIINDISAMTIDPDMVRTAVKTGAGIILMHMRGSPRTMQENPVYSDVVPEITEYLSGRVEALVSAGAEKTAIAVDPGICFGKTVEHNLAILSNLRSIANIGRPLIVGLSRKSFLGKLTGKPVEARLAGTIAATAFCVMNGADVLRVHDTEETLDAVRVVSALIEQKDFGKYVG